jgi:hypothetical protein
MRKIIILAAALLPIACSNIFDSSEVTKCENYVVSKLDRPESYRRNQHSSLSLQKFWEVGIEYSYIDKSGTRVPRAWQICDYPIVNGKPNTSKFLKLGGSDGRTQSSAN